MNDLKIYVATHKKFEKKLPEYYEPILVGSYNKNIDEYTRDDTKTNISIKNENYCELTGLYWIWKNDTTNEIVGLCHYRRYFKGDENGCISKKTIKKILECYDVIVPKPLYYTKDVYYDYCKNHFKKDIDRCEKIIEEQYPEYFDSFKIVMKRKYIYLYNMFICKKQLIDDYCTWLFEILEKMEESTDIVNYDNYQKRIYGFLSERLFNVWIEKNHFRVKEIQVYKIGDSKLNVLKYNIKNNIKKIISKINIIEVNNND